VESPDVWPAPARGAAIAIRAFDTFELAFDGRPVERWRAGKARGLLQFLMLRPGRTVPRDTLHEALWPDAPWSAGSSSLKVAAHMLRSILDGAQDAAGHEKQQPVLRLLTRESGYSLQMADVAADFQTFVQLADAGNAAHMRGEENAASTAYRQAVAEYRGEFLPDVSYDWAGSQREWLRGRLLCALTYLTGAGLAQGDHEGVLRWCALMLEAEPCHEETYRALMLVHGNLGHLEQVHRWYRLYTTRLRDRLQLTPDPAMHRLYTMAAHGEFIGRQLDAELIQPEPHAARPIRRAALTRISA
jgi:DNA-binding SARP family transcriptional activator